MRHVICRVQCTPSAKFSCISIRAICFTHTLTHCERVHRWNMGTNRNFRSDSIDEWVCVINMLRIYFRHFLYFVLANRLVTLRHVRLFTFIIFFGSVRLCGHANNYYKRFPTNTFCRLFNDRTKWMNHLRVNANLTLCSYQMWNEYSTVRPPYIEHTLHHLASPVYRPLILASTFPFFVHSHSMLHILNAFQTRFIRLFLLPLFVIVVYTHSIIFFFLAYFSIFFPFSVTFNGTTIWL